MNKRYLLNLLASLFARVARKSPPENDDNFALRLYQEPEDQAVDTTPVVLKVFVPDVSSGVADEEFSEKEEPLTVTRRPDTEYPRLHSEI